MEKIFGMRKNKVDDLPSFGQITKFANDTLNIIYALRSACLFRYGRDFDFGLRSSRNMNTQRKRERGKENRTKFGIKIDESKRWGPKSFDECSVENEQ